MQSVFGFHDLSRFSVYLYATTPSDGSPYRQKIEREAQHFLDVSAWSNQQVVERIVMDNIHVLMNLNGYTKGARNEIFAARPCPVQMEFMGFAGSMASRWTDWVVADPIVCPPEMTSVDRWRQLRLAGSTSGAAMEQRLTDLLADLDPEEASDEWVYPDRFVYMPHTYFVNDHKQGFRESVPTETIEVASQAAESRGGGAASTPTEEQLWASEELKRYAMRRELFPKLPDDYVIFADFNQLYKCDPMLFKLWLRILKRVPKSILWLLRFPAAGEHHLLREARQYAGDDVAARVIFTDVAPKHIHIHRGRIADLFLDTTECNAHTTAADILWSATPVLTWPRHMHKMCSRVAASIVHATGFGDEMTVHSEREYEERAVQLAESLHYVYWTIRGARSSRSSTSTGRGLQAISRRTRRAWRLNRIRLVWRSPRRRKLRNLRKVQHRNKQCHRHTARRPPPRPHRTQQARLDSKLERAAKVRRAQKPQRRNGHDRHLYFPARPHRRRPACRWRKPPSTRTPTPRRILCWRRASRRGARCGCLGQPSIPVR